MGVITLEAAREMVKLYAKTRRKLIDETYHIKDTKAIWFSTADLKTFVESLTPDITGVRFYLAVNESTSILPDQTTIVLIGTIDVDGKNVDPIGNPGTGNTGTGSGQDPFNHGDLCPPGQDCAPS